MATAAAQTHEPVWCYSRAERLAEILRRTRTTVEYLYRELVDAKPGDRPALHARRLINEARVRRYAALARTARRNERLAASAS